MKWSLLLAGLPFACAATSAALADVTTIFANVSIFTIPDKNYSSYITPKVLYARTLVLDQGCGKRPVLLATWENYNPEPPYFPIYQSDDEGRSWREISRVHDQVNKWGLRYQPHLFELPQAIGNFSAGTLLLSGSSIPADLSQTQIELYASTDRGLTWKFISHIARGGVAKPNNGETPVWEPFLMVHNNQLIVYYSDQRDKAHGQKMVHQTTTDLYRWTDPVDDVAYPTYSYRPGMPTVAKLPNGQFIMTYEYGGGAGFAVYYKFATDPLKFGSATGQALKATDGTVPVSSPYVVWTPAGGADGTLVVSANSDPALFINRKLGAANAWEKVGTKERRSYTRSLSVMPSGEILIAGGGFLPPNNNRYVDAGLVSVGTLPNPRPGCPSL